MWEELVSLPACWAPTPWRLICGRDPAAPCRVLGDDSQSLGGETHTHVLKALLYSERPQGASLGRTFADEEAGVDEQPVTVFRRRLQRQSRRQLVLQEGQRHALL